MGAVDVKKIFAVQLRNGWNMMEGPDTRTHLHILRCVRAIDQSQLLTFSSRITAHKHCDSGLGKWIEPSSSHVWSKEKGSHRLKTGGNFSCELQEIRRCPAPKFLQLSTCWRFGRHSILLRILRQNNIMIDYLYRIFIITWSQQEYRFLA